MSENISQNAQNIESAQIMIGTIETNQHGIAENISQNAQNVSLAGLEKLAQFSACTALQSSSDQDGGVAAISCIAG